MAWGALTGSEQEGGGAKAEPGLEGQRTAVRGQEQEGASANRSPNSALHPKARERLGPARCLLPGQGPACSPGSKVAEGLSAAAASLAIMGEMRPLLAEILSMMEAGGTETEVAAAGAGSPAPEAARVGVSGVAEATAPDDMAARRPGVPTGREALPRPGRVGK